MEESNQISRVANPQGEKLMSLEFVQVKTRKKQKMFKAHLVTLA